MKNTILKTILTFLGNFGLKKAWELYQTYVLTSEKHVKIVITVAQDGVVDNIALAKLLDIAPNGDYILSFVVSTARIGSFVDGKSVPIPFQDGKSLVFSKIKAVEIFQEEPTT